MKALYYNDLDSDKVKKKLEKTVGFLEAGDFKSAEVKKMPNVGFYSARLDDTNRLLFQIGDFEGKKHLLLLEVILNHAYEKSRFLNGAVLDENKLIALPAASAIPGAEIPLITYVNPRQKSFHLLDKILSFDDIQSDILYLPAPNIIIGSAGSGKTALTLEKMKLAPGRILYTTLSPYLVESAQALYHSFDYENPKQEIEFLSFLDYMSTIDMPKGKEVDFRTFSQWISRYKQSHKIKDPYKVFEEFKGVITGSVVEKPYLSLEDYVLLGVKQSIFSDAERPQIYDLFLKYLDWLKENPYFDSNLAAFALLHKIEPVYDFVVVDEVQDITNVQLMAILKSLHTATNFVLCGDSNQIVHPNFFSWSQIKSLFYKQDLKGNIIRILATNYRNTPEVTHIANQLLLVKNARFGSIDKESAYLVKPNSRNAGSVEFLENQPKVKQELNQKTRRSTRFAVLVMRNEDKAVAKQFFQTPLLFSIQEAKGLEYESIILYNFISSYDAEFRELTNGVTAQELEAEDIKFARAKDKSDKSLDEYKFYVNSLYVGITRAVKNLYVVETNKKHQLLALLGLTNFKSQTSVKEETSSQDDWRREARRLEMQGKQEQADAIRKDVLQMAAPPWEITTRKNFDELVAQALNPEHFNKKAKDRLFQYALFYGKNQYFKALSELKYRPADNWLKESHAILNKLSGEYQQNNLKLLTPKLQKYGIDFRNEINLTPFLMAVHHGSVPVAQYLAINGADTHLTDNFGRNALQLALFSAAKDESYKKNALNVLYPILKTESLKVKIGNRLVVVDHSQAEYIMLYFMISVLKTRLAAMNLRKQGRGFMYDDPSFRADDFMTFYEGTSEHIVRDYRRVRSYISSILSKNEINREDKYNKKLFVRMGQGSYLPNPILEVLADEEWINIYDLIDIHAIHEAQFGRAESLIGQLLHYRQQLLTDPDGKVDAEKYRNEMHEKFWAMMKEEDRSR